MLALFMQITKKTSKHGINQVKDEALAAIIIVSVIIQPSVTTCTDINYDVSRYVQNSVLGRSLIHLAIFGRASTEALSFRTAGYDSRVLSPLLMIIAVTIVRKKSG